MVFHSICTIFEFLSKILTFEKTQINLVFSSLIRIFAVMNQFKRFFVWLSRIHRCRGFGIQSPTDYSFVRYVINEHWPYYGYEQLEGNDWLTNKLGRLYFRLANWRQPTMMLVDDYQRYLQAGCNKTTFAPIINKVELARVTIDDKDGWEVLLSKCDNQSVIVVEGLWRNWERWHEIEADERTAITFDLYYCGIVFFDKTRYKHNYKINF